MKKLWYRRNNYHRKRNPANNTDMLVYNICKSIMRLKDSELFPSPISGDKFIVNDRLGINITIKDNIIEIHNHTFGYMISINRFILKDILKYFNRILESRNRIIHINRGKNMNDSLTNLLNKLQ
jgi:hypothetical protein